MQKNEKNYYEILEISLSATPDEIELAYRKAKTLYSEDSVAVYSLYTSEEREQKLSELLDMYSTLSDPSKRRAYDDYLKAEHIEKRKEWDVNSVASGKDIFEEYTEAGAFRDKLSLKKAITVMDNSDPMFSEKYRILFNKLEQMCLKNSFKSFAVTSAIKGEGKTVTTLNLAYIMAAEFKKKVLVIESDLRNPAISSDYLNMGRLYGLVDVLKGDADVRSAINRLEDTNLYFLPARCSVKNSSLLLDSPQMRNLMTRAREDFDYVIVDCPPILPLVDISMISKSIDAFLLVVRAGSTPKDIVKKAAKSLPEAGLLGIVLNGADHMHMNKYYY
ncbi:MAG: polysaccharide biosynthesis tyrosine autokinase [Deltaproteobacteria bacterium]|nr:polysaccharide biosynthesis tyrosine autokinase [Deltaproteobacteria bacterium]